MKIWVVAKIEDTPKFGETGVEIVGVYDAEELGVKACTTRNHWIAPLNLNETLPDEPCDIHGAHFPIK